MKEIKRRERRATVVAGLITSIYLIIWVINLSNVELQVIIPYIILNVFLTMLVCAFFLALFGGVEAAEERIMLERLSQDDAVEVFLKKIINIPDENTYMYNAYEEMGAKFYAKLYEEKVFLIIECDGKQEYTDYIMYETFKKNFQFA